MTSDPQTIQNEQLNLPMLHYTEKSLHTEARHKNTDPNMIENPTDRFGETGGNNLKRHKIREPAST